jgi:hypothetical protein
MDDCDEADRWLGASSAIGQAGLPYGSAGMGCAIPAGNGRTSVSVSDGELVAWLQLIAAPLRQRHAPRRPSRVTL